MSYLPIEVSVLKIAELDGAEVEQNDWDLNP